MKKRILSILLSLSMIAAMMPMMTAVSFAANPTWDELVSGGSISGSGAENDPYLIGTLEQLNAFADEVNDGNSFQSTYFKLTADIGSEAEPFTKIIGVIVAGWDDGFKGCFDGTGHTVYIEQTGGFYHAGLFGRLEGTAVVRNLVVDGTITNEIGDAAMIKSFIGGICGENYGTIEDCISSVKIRGTHSNVGKTWMLGGICGNCEGGGKIIACNYYGDISVTTTAQTKNSTFNGGICGVSQQNTLIQNCVNYGIVGDDYDYAGGICAANSGKIDTCVNACDLGGAGNYLAGICGQNYSGASIVNCTNNGNISSDTGNGVAGICSINRGKVFNCLNNGDISTSVAASRIAGICAINYQDGYEANIDNCFNNGDVIPVSVTAGGYAAILCAEDSGNIGVMYYNSEATIPSSKVGNRSYASHYPVTEGKIKAESGTADALIDRLNAYRRMGVYPEGWLKWTKQAGESVELPYAIRYVGGVGGTVDSSEPEINIVKNYHCAGDSVTLEINNNDSYLYEAGSLKAYYYNAAGERIDISFGAEPYTFSMPEAVVFASIDFYTIWGKLNNAMQGAPQETLGGQFTVSEDTPSAGVRTIKLLSDITATSDDAALIVNATKEIVLDLNGHVLNRGLVPMTGAILWNTFGSAITINEGAKLSIIDETPAATVHNGHFDTSGLWHWDKEAYSLQSGEISYPITGGIITGGTGNRNSSNDTIGGAGIYMAANADLSVTGGSIAGNKTYTSSGSRQGAGMYLNEGASANLDNCNFIGNIGYADGSAIYALANSTINISGGAFYKNRNQYGGGTINTKGILKINVNSGEQRTEFKENYTNSAYAPIIYANGASEDVVIRNTDFLQNEFNSITTLLKFDGCDVIVENCNIGDNTYSVYYPGSQAVAAFELSDGDLTIDGGAIENDFTEVQDVVLAKGFNKLTLKGSPVICDRESAPNIFSVRYANWDSVIDLSEYVKPAAGTEMKITADQYSVLNKIISPVDGDYSPHTIITGAGTSANGRADDMPAISFDCDDVYLKFVDNSATSTTDIAIASLAANVAVSGSGSSKALSASLNNDPDMNDSSYTYKWYEADMEEYVVMNSIPNEGDGVFADAIEYVLDYDDYDFPDGSTELVLSENNDGVYTPIVGWLYSDWWDYLPLFILPKAAADTGVFTPDDNATVDISFSLNGDILLDDYLDVEVYGQSEGWEDTEQNGNTFSAHLPKDCYLLYIGTYYLDGIEISNVQAMAVDAANKTLMSGKTNSSIPYSDTQAGKAYACQISIPADEYLPAVVGLTNFVSPDNESSSFNIIYKDKGDIEFSGTHEVGYPTTHNSGTETSLKSASKNGFSFGGWFTNSDCTGNPITVLDATAYTADITLYAKWIEVSPAPVYYGGGVSYYDITANGSVNGSFKVDRSSMYSGGNVTVTVTPDKGFVLETLTVLDKNGKEIEVKDLGNNKYSFTMPSGKVDISATFMEDNRILNYCVDVKADDYYYDSVLWAYENEICKGIDELHFNPLGIASRAEMLTFMWRAAGSPEPTVTTTKFTDVDSNQYYYKAVLWAVEKGITTGTSETEFSPSLTVDRAQTVTFLARFAGVKNDAAGYTHIFTDVNADAYYNNAVAWAYENKITGGTGNNTFSPDDDCLRAQVVTFLYRYFVK